MSEQDARDRLVSGLREGLTRAAAESEPIDYDTLEAYVDDRLDEADREIVDTRLADDPELRREVEELRALRALLPGTAEVSAPAPPEKRVVLPIDSGRRAPARARSFWQVSPTFAAAASVVLLLGVGAAWWFRARIGVAPADQRIAGGAAPSGAGRPASRPTTRPTEPPSPGSTGSETRVRDGEHLVALTADRSVTGLEALDPAMRARVGEMLASGKLPSSPAGLQGSAGQLLSAPRTGQPSAAAFGVRVPVGVAVRDAQPLFYWAPAPGASSVPRPRRRRVAGARGGERGGGETHVAAAPAAAAWTRVAMAGRSDHRVGQSALTRASGARGAVPRADRGGGHRAVPRARRQPRLVARRALSLRRGRLAQRRPPRALRAPQIES